MEGFKEEDLMGNLNGLAFINLELTSRCNKGDGTPGSGCWMCGRRKMEREYPELCDWGDMPYEMVQEISRQVPRGVVVQYHSNGEPLLFPRLGDALSLYGQCIRAFDTNGKLLVEKSGEIIGNMETLTVSVIQDDPEQEEQYEIVKEFRESVDRKGVGPSIVLRFLGRIHREDRWLGISKNIARRVLHSPMGSRDYEKRPVVPEIGICLDLLSHLAIDRYGNISLCVRFDPHGYLRIGHVNEGIEKAWNSEKRKHYIRMHIEQRRKELPGCHLCEYWGVPTSP